MKIISKTEKATRNDPNVNFKFDDSVDQFLVGATSLYYAFGSKDHHVQKIKLSMNASNAGQEVSVATTMTLKDDGNNSISSDSFVEVGCLAATGQNSNSTVQLTSGLKFPSEGTSNPIGLQNNTYVNEALLTGFELAYEGNSDHHIKRIYANVSASIQQGQSVTLSGTDDMYDSSGNSAVIKNLEAGYFGTYIDGNASGLVVKEKSYSSSDGGQTVDLADLLGDKKLTGATVFIRSFDTSFDKDHHLKSIYLGAENISYKDQKVSFTPKVKMKDNSSHNASGTIKLIIVGLCDAD